MNINFVIPCLLGMESLIAGELKDMVCSPSGTTIEAVKVLEDKGFRGIGRLGGLGYCSKLKFETSYFGEDKKSIMTWDAELLKYIINDRDNNEEAVEVLSRVTNTSFEKTYGVGSEWDNNEHYIFVYAEYLNTSVLNYEVQATFEIGLPCTPFTSYVKLKHQYTEDGTNYKDYEPKEYKYADKTFIALPVLEFSKLSNSVSIMLSQL